jgi:hypothetical protein
MASVYCHKDVINFVLLGIQDDYKVTAKRMAYSKDRYKMETKMPSFSCF